MKSKLRVQVEAAFRDIFATHVVVDGTIVTGQNQNSEQEVDIEVMRPLEQMERRPPENPEAD